MNDELAGVRVAFLVANEGVEQRELTDPWDAVRRAGGEPVLLAPEAGTVQCFEHLDRADVAPVDATVHDASSDEFDALVLPGGVANADELRLDDDGVQPGGGGPVGDVLTDRAGADHDDVEGAGGASRHGSLQKGAQPRGRRDTGRAAPSAVRGIE